MTQNHEPQSWTREWRRTVIGGDVCPYDFVFCICGVSIARIIRVPHGPDEGKWDWSLFIGGYDFLRSNSGTSPSKQEAVDAVRAKFETYLTMSPDEGGGRGYEPEEMLLDASAHILQHLKRNDPDAFWNRIEDIRAGRVDRNYYYWRKSPHLLAQEKGD